MNEFDKTKLLGCDFDDTITSNSMEVYLDLYRGALHSMDIDVPTEELRELVQPVWGSASLEVIGHVAMAVSTRDGIGGVKASDIKGAVDVYERELRSGTFVDKVELVPGALDTLQAIKDSGVQLGLATGVAPEILRQLLEKYKAPEHLFIETISAYDIRRPELKKPNPWSLKRLKAAAEAVQRSGILDREVVYVGDSMNDIKMAQSLPGVEPVAVLTGNLSREKAQKLLLPGFNILSNICEIEMVLERRESQVFFN